MYTDLEARFLKKSVVLVGGLCKKMDIFHGQSVTVGAFYFLAFNPLVEICRA
jgi:hypothetical protein